MRTDFQHLLISQDNSVLTITMNRPEVLNAFNDTMLGELNEAIEAAAQDDAVRCIVITGAGRGFGSGQDLKDLAAVGSTTETGKVSEHLQKYHRVINAIRYMPKLLFQEYAGLEVEFSVNLLWDV